MTLTGGSFALRPGDTAGLVGRNGAGKTSLLRVLAGDDPPAGGVVLRPGALGFLPQNPRPRGTGVDSTALSHVLSGRGLDAAAVRVEKLRLKVGETASERDAARFAHAEEEFRAGGGYEADSQVRRIAAGLGLADDRLDLPIDGLSGGERRRVELTRILFAGSDALLLDEPTNHLDNDAKQWLIGFLRSYRGALLVVSHDLELLDSSITRVLHLDEGTLVDYRGNYSQYRTARAADEERLRRLAARQGSEIGRLRRQADGMRGQTQRRARVAKSLDTRRARLERDAVSGPARERSISVRFPDPPRPGAVVLEAAALDKGYGGPPVFTDVSFDVGRGERLLVLGLNGAGKTTLMRLLAGHADADSGTIRMGHKVSAGYYAQEHEGITAGRGVLDHLRDAAGAPDQQLRSLLGTFGLSGEIAFQDAGTLSGGEKTKLALAQLVAGRHNVLLLDEPTNNLDPPSRDAVGTALRAWPGTIVLVSHDTDFVNRLEPDRALLMPEGDLDAWSDDLLDLVALA
ncbi:MAG TPA: ABC-F family ATP-binding cassette domain-containing protein [Acidimicrobiia bacterium]|nr:ABC-F family ATP-binding cassette domain-containing protein [Acidimicrobiia bacterium]